MTVSCSIVQSRVISCNMGKHNAEPGEPTSRLARRLAVIEDGAMVEERRRLLVEQVDESGRLVATEEAGRFGVSEDTIRRDLRVLSSKGLVQRVRGGALPVVPPQVHYETRVAEASEEKGRLAERAAAHLCESGGVVVLDGGSTNLLVAESLSATASITVVTSSPSIGSAASQRGIRTVMLGGVVDQSLGSAVDATATLALAGIRADKVVLGACAVHPDTGVTTARADEVEFKRAVVGAGGEVIVVAADDKLMTAAPYVVAGADAIDVLVVSPDRDASEFADAGVEVLVA